MFSYTTITTDNDAVHLSAQLVDGVHKNPMLTFYRIRQSYERNWRTTDDEIAESWDNSKFLIDDLYINIVKHCKLGMDASYFDSELQQLLEASMCPLQEIKELLTEGIAIGFFDNVECDFFK